MVELQEGLSWLPLFALDRVSDFVIITDGDVLAEGGPRMIYVNRALMEATGYAEAELIGQSPRIFQGKNTDKAALARVKAGLRAGRTIREEVLNYTKQGRPYWTELNIAPIRDASGQTRFFLSVQRDVTEKRLVSEARERDRRLFAAGEIIGDLGTWSYDVAEDRILWSDGAYTLLDLEKGQTPQPAEEYLNFIAPPDRPAMLELMDRCIDHAMPFEREFAGLTAKGIPLRLAIRGEPLLGEDGRTIAVVGAIRDITNQQRVLDALIETLTHNRKMERYFASARHAAKIGTFDYSVGQDLQYWSDELLEMTGLSNALFPAPAEAFVSGIDQADRPLFDELFGRAIHQGEDYNITVRFHRPDGRIMHMNVIAEVHDEDGDRRIVGIARDVTEEVEASALLKLQEERFRIIADSVSDVLWDYDIEQSSFWASPNWQEKLGLNADLAQFSSARWVEFVASEDREETRASLIEALKSGVPVWRRDCRVVDDDGKKADVEIIASILRRDNGRAYRLLGNLRNVTQEKRLQEGFTRSRALEAVGQMTGGVAHDFNNLLMIIQGNAELLGMSQLDEEDRESIQLITKASEAAANLTAKLLSFSGQTRLNNTHLNLRDLMDELLPLLKSGLTSAITVRSNIASDICDIEVDVTALEQAIINLAVNARDAMPDGGTIEIAGQNHIVADDMVGASYEFAPGQYVCISVSDNGEGMSEEVMAKACEPFFTTKDVGKGTGLGLSSAYGFAKQSGGALQIYSEVGRGSTVKLYLPVSKASNAPRPEVSDAEIAPVAKGQRVLVVEDQPEVRSHVEKLLTKAGYEVTSAENALAALALLEAGEVFDVLFTDVIMPGGMNGVQLASAAVRILPDMKVLFTSGFPASAFAEVGVHAWEGFDLLQKPYKAMDLITAVNASAIAGQTAGLSK